jgi:hypothetical protein
MQKKAGVANVGEEELTRLRMGRQSLGDVENTLRVLFGSESVKNLKKSDVKKIEDLFVMHGANITQAPNLTKEAKAPATAAFFQKLSTAHLTQAQLRYPELLKVSSSAAASTPSSTSSSTPTPNLKPIKRDRAQGPIPTQSMMAGGAA